MNAVLEQTQEAQLINEKLKASDARDLISGLVNAQVNFHKIQHLSRWMGDQSTSKELLERKIETLGMNKEGLDEMIRNAQKDGRILKVETVIKISVE